RTAAPPRPRRKPRRRTSRRSARPRRPRRPPPRRSRSPSRERRLTAVSPANPATAAIVDGFAAYRTGFDTITRRAQERFRQRDWSGAVADAVERLDLYGEVVDAVEHEVRRALGDRITDPRLWTAARAQYTSQVAGRSDRDLAETFFNSITRRVF